MAYSSLSMEFEWDDVNETKIAARHPRIIRENLSSAA